MIRKHVSMFLVASSLVLSGCVDEWLTTEPQTILTDEQVWGDPGVIESVFANFYARLPQWNGLDNNQWGRWGQLDEGMSSGQNAGGGRGTLGYGSWEEYDWGLMRDIHVAMEGIENSEAAQVQDRKAEFLAELRFLRAFIYFELVKRHGGVPLITEQLLYDFSGDPAYLHEPRAAEAEIYDFIAAELDAIRDDLANEGSQSRANAATALALKSRAMLYAGSIARYNAQMASPITLPGGVVGIPEDRAEEYYQKSLEASRALIQGGTHSLVTGADPSEAFHSIFYSKGNPEVIMARDYNASGGQPQWFSMRGRPQSMKVDQFANWAGAEMAGLLNVAETFDHLDGSSGVIRGAGDGTVAGQANWIFYDEMDDAFEEKDRRYHATLLGPGGTFAGQTVDLQAGVAEWNGSNYTLITGESGTTHDDGGTLTGLDGPIHQEGYQNPSGFFIKKYLDPDPAAGRYAPGGSTWWVRFRLGEIYMNAAEAAFELGLMDEALGYVNTLRERAGFPPNSLTTLDFEKIQSERWAELAYEDHRLWDQKRWRTAHITWNGDPQNPSARLWVLYPYRVVHPGSPNDGKYVFDRFISTQNTSPIHFRLGNYYSEIPESDINANPELVRNPFH